MSKPAQRRLIPLFPLLLFLFPFFLFAPKVEVHAACYNVYKNVTQKDAECKQILWGFYYCKKSEYTVRSSCFDVPGCGGKCAARKLNRDCFIPPDKKGCTIDATRDTCVSCVSSQPTPTPTPTPPPGCSCTGWRELGCGVGSCTSSQMRYTQDCTPDKCQDENKCVTDSRCRGAPAPAPTPTPTPTPTPPPPTTECTPGTWSSSLCASCNAQGLWNPSCTDWGSGGSTWCACELKCTGQNSPQCRSSSGRTCVELGGRFCAVDGKCPADKGYVNKGATSDCLGGCCGCQ